MANTEQPVLTQFQLAHVIARAIVREYRIYPGPTWQNGEDGEAPLQVELYVKELSGVPRTSGRPSYVTLESDIKLAEWPISQMKYLREIELVSLKVVPPKYSWQDEICTGVVVVKAIDSPR